MVPEIIKVVLGFGIFKIGVDLTKFSRLESWMTRTFLRGVKKVRDDSGWFLISYR